MTALPLRHSFFRSLAQTSDFPLALEVERAEGVWMYGPGGQRWMDLISGIGVSSLGHRHPRVVEAIHEQVDRHLHVMVYGELVQAPQVRLAELLCAHLPAALNRVYLVSSGAEAIEGALKLAKRCTGKTELISCINAYHGSTHGALSIMGSEYFKQAYRPLLPDTRLIAYNNFEDIARITSRTAAVVVETVQGESGYIPPLPGYLHALRRRCTETGTLLVFDEIQCGYGRTGSLWAFEQEGVVPDVLCLAKAMGGGMPIGAFIASETLMEQLQDHPYLGHITTFGGHPVSAAAALAALQVITEERLWEGVPEKARQFAQNLRHPRIRSITGRGLMIGVEFGSFAENKTIIDACIRKGLLTDWFLFNAHTMRLAPPLTITPGEIDWACEVILSVL